ncbi:hypothetical protein Indivirus_1_162 [Indivirus ILV1]|uniref:Uncharacterized protein n=1 Tax=Indivirus ILV1 TaxID=1977633 RepID=A0A1V0SCV1_9VIRU|nr:hypothetical protein Indivirus_1_162 [Indivirus ILV1]
MQNQNADQYVPEPIMPYIKKLEGAPAERAMLTSAWNNMPLNYVPSHDQNFKLPSSCVDIMPITGIEGFGSSSDLLRIVILFLIVALIYYLLNQN